MVALLAMTLAALTSTGSALPTASASSRPVATYTLRAAIARALATHLDLAISKDEAQKALLTLEDAQSQRFALDANLSAAAVHEQSNILGPGGTQPPGDIPSANGTLNLTIPVFTGWKTSDEIVSARRSLDAANADRETARQSVELSVIGAFWDLRRDQLLLGNDQVILDQAQASWRETQVGLAVGRNTQDAVDQAQIAVLAARSDRLAQAGQTQQAQAQLAQLLDVPATGLAITGAPTASPPTDLIVLADLPSALARRPDVQAARLRVRAASAALEATRGDLWPQIALSTSYQQGNLASNPVTGVRQVGSFAGTWQAQIEGSYDLFDMGAVGRKIARAAVDRQEALAQYDKLARQVRTDLDQALAAATSAADRVGIDQSEVELAQKHLQAVQVRYQDGLALAIEVDAARARYQTALNQRVRTLIDYEIALAQLRRAAGLL